MMLCFYLRLPRLLCNCDEDCKNEDAQKVFSRQKVFSWHHTQKRAVEKSRREHRRSF